MQTADSEQEYKERCVALESCVLSPRPKSIGRLGILISPDRTTETDMLYLARGAGGFAYDRKTHEKVHSGFCGFHSVSSAVSEFAIKVQCRPSEPCTCATLSWMMMRETLTTLRDMNQNRFPDLLLLHQEQQQGHRAIHAISFM